MVWYELSLTFTKRAENKAEAKKFQSEIIRHIEEMFERASQYCFSADGKASVVISLSGPNIYRQDSESPDDVLLGADCFSAKKLSHQLDCRLKIDCYGEEPGDEDERVYEKGELVKRWENVKVDVKTPEVQEFDRIIDDIERKGLGEEAQRLRVIARKMAARYLFSSSSDSS